MASYMGGSLECMTDHARATRDLQAENWSIRLPTSKSLGLSFPQAILKGTTVTLVGRGAVFLWFPGLKSMTSPPLPAPSISGLQGGRFGPKAQLSRDPIPLVLPRP